MKKAKKLSLKQRAKKAGIPAQTVYDRRKAGWSESKALSTPVGKYTTRKPKKVEPKKADDQLWGTEARKKKVEPKKAPSPLPQRTKSTVTLKQNPIPIQKFEGKKTAMDSQRTVILSLAVIVVVAVLVVVYA
jgi:hypothetical protein